MPDRPVDIPAPFQSLQGLLGDWVGLSEAERVARRAAAPTEDLQRIYAEAMPVMPELLSCLASEPVDGTSAVARTLYEMALVVVEVSFPVEVYGSSRPEANFDEGRIVCDTDDGLGLHSG